MKFLKFAVLAVACAQPGFACDLCAIYAANEAHGEIGKGVFAGVAEQFTHFGTLQDNGHEVANDNDEFLNSSITQVLLGYNFTERFGVQVNAPIIHRSFRRLVGHAIERDHETGLGDISLIGHLQVYRHEKRDFTFNWNVLAGVKFPTGCTTRLGEEAAEEGDHEHPSGVHGHDLTLGSGSFDGIVGMSVLTRWKRAFMSAGLQYAIRTRGDFDYEYADDLTWAGGPGMFVILNESFTLSLQANVTGETKGKDEFDGEAVGDTGITAVYLGPEILATWRDKLGVELGLDLPIIQNNTGLQIVPDYRVRAALTWHF